MTDQYHIPVCKPDLTSTYKAVFLIANLILLLSYLKYTAQLTTTSAKLNSEQHKLCLQKLERFLNQKGTLLRSTLTNILSEIKTCHKMDDLNQYQLNLLCSQFQSHLVTLKLVNPDFPSMFNLNFSQPRDDEVEIIEPTSSAGGRAPSSALSLSAPSTSELSPSTSQ